MLSAIKGNKKQYNRKKKVSEYTKRYSPIIYNNFQLNLKMFKSSTKLNVAWEENFCFDFWYISANLESEYTFPNAGEVTSVFN